MDVIALVLLVEVVGMSVGWAAFLAAGSGAIVGFTLSRCWAFRDRGPMRKRQVGAYALVSLANAAAVAYTVHILAVIVGMLYLLAKGIAAVVVFAVWSYPAQSKLVFPAAARRER